MNLPTEITAHIPAGGLRFACQMMTNFQHRALAANERLVNMCHMCLQKQRCQHILSANAWELVNLMPLETNNNKFICGLAFLRPV